MEQQTLEQAAKQYKDLHLPDDHYDAFIAGATWQAKRMYTVEQLLDAIHRASSTFPYTYRQWTNEAIIESLKQSK